MKSPSPTEKKSDIVMSADEAITLEEVPCNKDANGPSIGWFKDPQDVECHYTNKHLQFGSMGRKVATTRTYHWENLG
jgi:hypothetical protein